MCSVMSMILLFCPKPPVTHKIGVAKSVYIIVEAWKALAEGQPFDAIGFHCGSALLTDTVKSSLLTLRSSATATDERLTPLERTIEDAEQAEVAFTGSKLLLRRAGSSEYDHHLGVFIRHHPVRALGHVSALLGYLGLKHYLVYEFLEVRRFDYWRLRAGSDDAVVGSGWVEVVEGKIDLLLLVQRVPELIADFRTPDPVYHLPALLRIDRLFVRHRHIRVLRH
ncbi:nucleotide exchange factor SIL1, putative [Babesia ovata]|uniref:Nucleotide exchange factor SIL1, putative n=1 Tax=Babesia ovata TaxID=189622 RepID=A0A2H6KG04_9APIC|nr:nucleotide exchange factor SIL1, putative [Babesia ovata]GBE61928.1 nucleotide exchange factor SIL1, putative [Babesia ovata]